jgi:hypothetical protein
MSDDDGCEFENPEENLLGHIIRINSDISILQWKLAVLTEQLRKKGVIE